MLLPFDVVAKLNECARTDFVSMRDLWFGRVSIATALVAFGLVLEAPELVHDLIPIGRKMVARLKKLPTEFSKLDTPDWVKVVAFVGWILIVVGVVGEEFAGIKVKNLDADIQECSDAKVKAATFEAGDAKTSADKSSAAAERADTDAGHAELEAKSAKNSAVVIASNLATQVDREKKAEFELEKEKAKRLELAASLVPRELCQQQKLLEITSEFWPRKVLFEFVSEKEPRRLAEEIAWGFGGFDRPAWPVARRIVDEDMIDEGVHIMPGWAAKVLPVTATLQEREGANAEYNRLRSSGMTLATKIRDALVSCDVDATAGEDTFAEMEIRNHNLPVDTLLIRVGEKPNRALESTIRELGIPPLLSARRGSAGNRRVIPDEIPADKQ